MTGDPPSNGTLSVVYATDENYARLTAVSMASLLTHNPGAAVTLLVNGVSEASLDFLQRLCERLGGRFAALDVCARLSALKEDRVNAYVSYAAYARLFIPQLMTETRVVYLDSDTLVLGDLSPLMTRDLGGKPFAAGYDCMRVEYKKMIGLPADAPYFNTGTLVIDTAVWRRRRCTERLLEFLPHVSPRAFFADQDLIACVLGSEAAHLPPAYNFLTHFQMFRSQRDVLTVMGIPAGIWYGEAEYAAARRAPIVHHFLGHTLGRPWYRESKNPMRAVYRHFAQLAGIPEVAEQSRPLDRAYRVQWLCWKTLPNVLFVQVCRALYRFFFWHNYGV